MQKLITGEDAVCFFAKYGATTPIKFIQCYQDPNYPNNRFKLLIAKTKKNID